MIIVEVNEAVADNQNNIESSWLAIVFQSSVSSLYSDLSFLLLTDMSFSLLSFAFSSRTLLFLRVRHDDILSIARSHLETGYPGRRWYMRTITTDSIAAIVLIINMMQMYVPGKEFIR